MVNENAGTEPESSAERRELQRIAFARPHTDADAAAAERALRTLVDADQESVAPVVPTEPPVEVIADPTEPPPDADSTETAARPRRGILALLVAAGLVLGLGAGVEIEKTMDATSASEPSDSRTFSAVVPGAAGRGDNAAAAAQLATVQTSADVFPVPNYSVSLGLQPKTVHLILTRPDGNSLWIGKTSAAMCLLFSDPRAELTNDDLDPSIANAGSSCATAEAFQESGLTVRNGSDSFFWNGVTFTATTG